MHKVMLLEWRCACGAWHQSSFRLNADPGLEMLHGLHREAMRVGEQWTKEHLETHQRAEVLSYAPRLVEVDEAELEELSC